MGDKTGIEWTDATWNPVRAVNKRNPVRTGAGAVGWFCVHVSEGCRNCYAEAINKRLGNGLSYKAQERASLDFFLHEDTLTQPLRWKRPRRIFVGSMTDLFGDWVTDAMLDRIFAVMALCPQHTFQVLTKRADRMRKWFAGNEDEGDAFTRIISRAAAMMEDGDAWWSFLSNQGWPLPNVWLGVSAEDQARADLRIPDLLATPAAVRFVSAEPLLGPVDLTDIPWPKDRSTFPGTDDISDGRSALHMINSTRLDWIIVGGESGPNARPMEIDHARSLVAQCRSAGVACFVKQLGHRPSLHGFTNMPLKDKKGGDMAEWPEDLRVREVPHGG